MHARTILFVFLYNILLVESFNFVLMARRGKGKLKEALSSKEPLETRSLNRGKGQEITGVTLPAEGRVKGWAFGDGVQISCANVGGKYFAVQGDCPRCAFDLFKGDVLINDAAFNDVPMLACPTCSTTYSLISGKHGPPYFRKGLAGFVSKLAKTATTSDSAKDAKAFLITRDEDGRVYCRDR
jgi:nitrite reductase/ring-hydroxylating ferredoxin subunit